MIKCRGCGKKFNSYFGEVTCGSPLCDAIHDATFPEGVITIRDEVVSWMSEFMKGKDFDDFDLQMGLQLAFPKLAEQLPE